MLPAEKMPQLSECLGGILEIIVVAMDEKHDFRLWRKRKPAPDFSLK